MVRHKPNVAQFKFLQILHQIRQSLNITITADSSDDFLMFLVAFMTYIRSIMNVKILIMIMLTI